MTLTALTLLFRLALPALAPELLGAEARAMHAALSAYPDVLPEVALAVLVTESHGAPHACRTTRHPFGSARGLMQVWRKGSSCNGRRGDRLFQVAFGIEEGVRILHVLQTEERRHGGKHDPLDHYFGDVSQSAYSKSVRALARDILRRASARQP